MRGEERWDAIGCDRIGTNGMERGGGTGCLRWAGWDALGWALWDGMKWAPWDEMGRDRMVGYGEVGWGGIVLDRVWWVQLGGTELGWERIRHGGMKKKGMGWDGMGLNITGCDGRGITMAWLVGLGGVAWLG